MRNEIQVNSFKPMYEDLIKTLTKEEEKELNRLYDPYDYKSRSIYLIKTRKTSWGKAPDHFIEKSDRFNVNNFEALLILLRQLKEVGLFLSQKPFINRKFDDKKYIISVQRTDRRYIDIYCSELALKDQIITDIKNFQTRLKFRNK